jgi:hypothetical protein
MRSTAYLILEEEKPKEMARVHSGRAVPEISKAREKLKFWAPLTSVFRMYEMMKNKYV